MAALPVRRGDGILLDLRVEQLDRVAIPPRSVGVQPEDLRIVERRLGLVSAAVVPTVDSARMAGELSAFTTDDPERDWAVLARHVAWQADTYRQHAAEGTSAEAPPPVDPERIRAKGLTTGFHGLLVATPDEVARRVLSHIGTAPIRTIYFWASIAGLPEDMVLRHVRTVCNELAPLLRASSA